MKRTGLLLFALSWCTPAAAQTRGACYDVHTGMWRAVTDARVTRPRRPPDQANDSTAYLLPPRVRLGDQFVDMAPFEGVWYDASAPAGALPTGHRHQGWLPAEGGVALAFSTGSAGIQGVATPHGGELSGVFRTFSELEGSQLYERDVTLTPVDCASPPPVPADALRRLPRAVGLAGGGGLGLGRPAPQGLATTERPSGGLGVEGHSTGLFAGSDSVAYRVGRNDGNVGVIQLVFPAPATPDALIARITAEYGPPDPDTNVPGGWWHSRITELSVIPNPEGGFRVLLQDPRSW